MVGTTTITDTTAWEYECAGCSRLHERALETVDGVRRERYRAFSWKFVVVFVGVIVKLFSGLSSGRYSVFPVSDLSAPKLRSFKEVC